MVQQENIRSCSGGQGPMGYCKTLGIHGDRWFKSEPGQPCFSIFFSDFAFPYLLLSKGEMQVYIYQFHIYIYRYIYHCIRVRVEGNGIGGISVAPLCRPLSYIVYYLCIRT